MRERTDGKRGTTMAKISKLIGKTCIFKYPKEFVTLVDYSAHRDCKVKVIRQLNQSESQCEFPMFEIQADDGWIGFADEYELEIIMTEMQLNTTKQGARYE